MKRIHLGVADFALPAPRRGHIQIDSGYGNATHLGQRVHQEIQRQRVTADPSYQAEVKVEKSFKKDGYEFVITGRIDGLFGEGQAQIEEIKSTFQLIDLVKKLMEQPWHPYWLQLQTYIYFYGIRTQEWAQGHLHLVSLRTGEAESLALDFDRKAYESWLERRLAEMVHAAERLQANIKRRRQIGRRIDFPFAQQRQGQDKLMAEVEASCAQQVPLAIQAPTGTGKTIGVLFPVLKDSLLRGERTVYVTPKNSQHSVAEEAVKKLREVESDLRSMSLTAKSKICFKDEPFCHPDHCQYARDYYEKVEQAQLVDRLACEPVLHQQIFKDYGERFEVCPFEIQLEAVENCDIFIGDYNYVFSPRNILGRLVGENRKRRERPNLIVDEVHNLPSRALSYFSQALSERQLVELRRQADNLPTSFCRPLRKLIDRSLETLKKYHPKDRSGQVVSVDVDGFLKIHEELYRLQSEFFEAHALSELDSVFVRYSRLWTDITQALQQEGEFFYTIYEPDPGGDELKVVCCDASQWLAPIYDNFCNVVAFSATLKPFEYYLKLLGLDGKETRTAELPSTFPRENRKLLVIPQISTRLRDRSRHYDRIVEVIERTVALRPGNYICFFPSFQFLQQVERRLRLSSFRKLVQRRYMKPEETTSYIEELRSSQVPTILLAVQGGVFSEGVDYVGHQLIGALVIGPGLPTFNLEQELLRQYYEKCYGDGFNYAYVYPAMTKVIQAAGRVIRSPEEQGLIVLVDKRFLHPDYQKAMPTEWLVDGMDALLSSHILEDISSFWRKGSKNEFFTDGSGPTA